MFEATVKNYDGVVYLKGNVKKIFERTRRRKGPKEGNFRPAKAYYNEGLVILVPDNTPLTSVKELTERILTDINSKLELER